ncbi:MAG: hypothetical protein K9H48_14910 [Melioribacteraceae bacterium]|nr:hypothetical protein [Saprospiraceae bacterium]MCF8355740.1 hypothetical protein [Melioribacteraceae bacterium]MCF8394768.1 hypothetical protein [Melioribacteraceae bacterium]
MKKYFYCESYQALLYALSLHHKNDQIIIISPSNDIIEASNAFSIPAIQNRKFSSLQYISERKTVRTELNRIEELINKDSFCFTHTQHSVFLFLLIEKLVKKNEIIFFDFEYEYNRVKKITLTKKYLKKFVIKTLLNRIYSAEIILKEHSNNYILSIDKNIFEKRGIVTRKIGESYFNDISELANAKNINIEKRCDYLYIEQIFKDNKQIIDRLAEIESFLVKKNFCIKLHPNHGKNESKFSECYKYPTYLPVEFILGSVNKCVVSVGSSSLILASKYPNIKAISLLDIVKDPENMMFEQVKNDLQIKSDNRIYFPKSIKEFINMIDNVKI